jgi:16S rRNA C967 or C1407 C5-methylase (RsmB/RsmF family)
VASKGKGGFEEHYRGVYGERWDALRGALLGPVHQVARVNPFCDPDHVSSRLENAGVAACVEVAGIRVVDFVDPGTAPAKHLAPLADKQKIFDFYIMDPASIFAARALDVKDGDEVLDLCAAPGGKSLILAQSLANGGRLVANEISDKRRARLRAVLNDYLPASMLGRVSVTGHDGTKWCLYEKNAFDRILLDAPCSGERHLLENPSELEVWSRARSKNLAVRQYALLASALAVVRPGGRIVYSTCSISPLENDEVIRRLMKKRPGEALVKGAPFVVGEATEFGHMIMPDRTGDGPIYFAVLERV